MKYIKVLSIFIWMMISHWAVAQSETTISVRGNCGMCQERIENTALEVIGVASAEWSAASEKLVVEVDDAVFNVEDLHKAIAGVGHDTDVLKADSEIYDDLPGCCQYTREETNKVNSVTIGVSGVCGMCQDRIETASLEVEGVEKAEWNIETKKLTVEVNSKFDENQLHKKLISVGHDTDKLKASDEVYEELHSCCLYRDEEVANAHDMGSKDEEERGTDSNDPTSLLNAYINSHEHEEGSHLIHGMVYENLTTEHPQPLIGANIRWEGGSTGTVTDLDGFFELPPSEDTQNLVISYVGYESDTIDMTDQSIVMVSLQVNNIIDDITVTYKKKATSISFLDPIKVQNINQKELFKAACCSLSESFETNPSIDVSFTDAVTGTRKVEMLGLAGPYVQVMRENMPYIRGIASVYGFEYTPGPWIESMQLNMGSGSVINGPESMTGQINVELKKPETSEKLFVNLYANETQRLEANVNTKMKLNDKWSTGLLLHGSTRNQEVDRNDDGFYDTPIGDQIFALNRWKYSGDNGVQAQFGIKGTYVDKTSGQIGNSDTENLWKAPISTERLEGWAKIGKVFEGAPYKSIGLQLSGSTHYQAAHFGNRPYIADQNTVYANLIYQTIIVDTDKKLKLGGSIIADQVDETVGTDLFSRDENTVGAFVELNQTLSEKVSMVLGLRGDYNNLYGFFATPRLHLRYSPEDNTAYRLAIGRGQRTPSIFAENIGLFASNRSIVIHPSDEDNSNLPYGLAPEVAYNIGANVTKEFIIDQRSLVIGLDYYYTTFDQQVVVDYDMDPREINFYNLDGKSYSHSIQAQMDYEVIDGVDIRLAYRFNDVKTDYQAGLRQKQLTPKHRAFVNTGIDLGKGWDWDGTLTWQGQQRIPDTQSSPAEFRQNEQSPDFIVFNTQLTKNIKDKGLSFYLGAENLFDYRQDNPIVNVDNPFNDYFDSSMIWGPVMGRNVYVGLRYTIL